MTLGACRGIDGFCDLPLSKQREFCAVCPVKKECFEWGVLHEKNNVWGGACKTELKAERRRRGIEVDTPELPFVLANEQRIRGVQGEIKHGTPTGYRHEIRQNLTVCPACRKASRDEMRERRAKGLA